MAYVSPTWHDGGEPALNAANMQALTDTVEGAQVLTGSTAPTTATAGIVGQFYVNTSNAKLYQCTAVDGGNYTWRATANAEVETVVVSSSGGRTMSITFQNIIPNVLFFSGSSRDYGYCQIAENGFGLLDSTSQTSAYDIQCTSYGQKTVSLTTIHNYAVFFGGNYIVFGIGERV